MVNKKILIGLGIVVVISVILLLVFLNKKPEDDSPSPSPSPSSDENLSIPLGQLPDTARPFYIKSTFTGNYLVASKPASMSDDKDDATVFTMAPDGTVSPSFQGSPTSVVQNSTQTDTLLYLGMDSGGVDFGLIVSTSPPVGYTIQRNFKSQTTLYGNAYSISMEYVS